MQHNRLMHFVLFYATSLAVFGVVPALCAPARAANPPPVEWVDVSVATLWNSPTSVRPVDHPSTTNPVHIERWLTDMTVKQRRWLGEHNITQTQALYGHKVYVLKEKGAWAEVAVPGQLTPKNPLGYPGWVPKVQLVSSTKFAAVKREHPFAVVDSAPTVWLYDGRKLAGKFMRISFNTRLPVLAQRDGAIEVATPADGTKWLAAEDVSVYASFKDIPPPTPAELVKTGRMFMGLPYLWGGRSGFAFDCSGFVGSIYQSHGIIIGRDTRGYQYDNGVRVSGHKMQPETLSKLQPGTLLYYASDDGTGKMYHVAMYVGGDRMMESYAAGTPVRTTKARFGKNFWGAIQVLRTTPVSGAAPVTP